MYVSIKNWILRPSGQKSRVCVNQPDRLIPPPVYNLIFLRHLFNNTSSQHAAVSIINRCHLTGSRGKLRFIKLNM